MSSITAIANDFFAACETGKGWEACKAYCAPNATFAAQAEPLAGIKTLAEYTDWMKGLMTIMPDGSYEVKSFAKQRRCLRCLFGYSYRSRWSVRADRQKDDLGLRLCDAVHRRQDQPHDEDLAFWNGTKRTRLGLNGSDLPQGGAIPSVLDEQSAATKERIRLTSAPAPASKGSSCLLTEGQL